MGLENKLGTIEPGMIADLLMLDTDPTQDVTVLGDPSHVCMIIKDGKQIDTALTRP
jgi:imidazolonepropionase-like amidohydrolase